MPVLRALLLALVLALLGASGAQAADLTGLDAGATSVSEQPAGDGIVAPGDTIAITQSLHNSIPGGLTGLHATLTPVTPGVAMGNDTSTFPDVAFDGDTANDTPYVATIPSTLACGQVVQFSLALTSDQGTATFPITVGTGVAGPFGTTASADVPRAIPDGSSVTSTLQIDQPGRVKDLRVDLGQLTHTYDGDLKIWIEAPDGSTATLVDQRGGDGDNFTDTVFASSGASLAAGQAPFTGTYRADGDLSALNGTGMQGTWTLHIADEKAGDSGTLINWGLELSPAGCDGQPIASFTATPNPVAPGATVTFDASASWDPNGTIDHYEWDLNGDGTYETDSGTTPTVSTSYPARGAVTVGLRVTDNEGLSTKVKVPIAVTQAPVAALTWTPNAPHTGDTINLDAGTSTADPLGSIVRYQWDLDGDGNFERNTGTTPTTTVSFGTQGVHTIRVRVTDDAGATSVHAVDITVLNRPPVAALTLPDVPVAGVPFTLDAGASTDPDGTIVRYEWDVDGDGAFDTDTGPTATLQQTWSAGPHTVSVRVTDDQGATAVLTLSRVVDAAPSAALAIGPSPAVAGAPVTMSAAGSTDSDGTIARYEWDLDGDGTFETDTGATPSVSHVYATAGHYDVALRVTDDRGVVSPVVTVPLTVEPAPSSTPAPDPGTPGTPASTPPEGSSPTPAGPAPSGPGGPGLTPGPTGPAAFSAGLLGAPIQALRLARRHGVTLRCHVAAAATCTLAAYLPGREARRLHLARAARHVRAKLVGRAVVRAQPGHDARVVLALSAPLRRALAHRRGTRLLVRATAVDALGRRVSMARVVLLRR